MRVDDLICFQSINAFFLFVNLASKQQTDDSTTTPPVTSNVESQEQRKREPRARHTRELADAFKRRVVTLQSSIESNKNRLDLWLPRKNSNEIERQFAELSAVVSGKVSKNVLLSKQK